MSRRRLLGLECVYLVFQCATGSNGIVGPGHSGTDRDAGGARAKDLLDVVDGYAADRDVADTLVGKYLAASLT